MAGDGYTSVALRDVPALGHPGAAAWRPVRHTLGIDAFGVNAYTAADAGVEVIEPHDEADSGHEELYFVVSGHATFDVAGDAIDAPAGTLVLVRDAALRRAARAVEGGTTVFCVGGEPGAAYEPLDWERRELAELGA